MSPCVRRWQETPPSPTRRSPSNDTHIKVLHATCFPLHAVGSRPTVHNRDVTGRGEYATSLVGRALLFRPGASCHGLCAWYAKYVLRYRISQLVAAGGTIVA